MGEVRYIISDASKKVDAEPHALRYWEEELGLAIPRNEMGHRYYREEDIRILKNVKFLKEQGFQLRAIKLILPNIHKIETLDAKSMLLLRNELNERVFELESRQEIHELPRENKPQSQDIDLEATNLIHLDEVRAEYKTSGVQEKLESATSEQLEQKSKDYEEKLRSAKQLEAKQDMQLKKEMQQNQEIQKKQEVEQAIEDVPTSKIKSDQKIPLRKFEVEQRTGDKEGLYTREDKMVQFKSIMSNLIMDALKQSTDELSNNIGKVVSISMAKELDYQFREREQREEQRYKHLDETIRAFQRGRAEVAAAQSDSSRKKNIFKRKELT